MLLFYYYMQQEETDEKCNDYPGYDVQPASLCLMGLLALPDLLAGLLLLHCSGVASCGFNCRVSDEGGIYGIAGTIINHGWFDSCV